MNLENKLKSMQELNDNELSFFASLILGDGCIAESGRLVVAHGNDQKDYCEWKANKLSEVLRQEVKALPTRQCTQLQVSRKFFKKKRDFYYPDNKKSLIRILKDVKNPLEAITVWICDDGNVSPSVAKNGKVYSSSIQIFTFTELEESQKIADWFYDKINIRPYLLFRDRSKTNRKSAYILKFSAEDSRKLFKLIKDYIPNIESMNYKFRYMFLDSRI